MNLSIKNTKYFRLIIIILILIVIMVIAANLLVEFTTMNLVYNDIDKIPYNKVGLVLGTTKYIKSGSQNPYYTYRISAAAELYFNEKIDYLLVSGDNAQIEYNEPVLMMNDLISLGVPREKIFMDYAGFRTLDSVVRSKEIFGQNSITVISQEFHNQRAIFISFFKGINAVGFNATDVNYKVGLKTNLREVFARVNMMLDLLINKQPRYLGESIVIE